jgi:hypothetical protein
MKPLSREYLIARGKCCGNGCLNCPYPISEENEMSMNLRIDAIEDLEPRQNEPIPAGKYVAICEKAVDESNKVSKAGDTYSSLNLQFRILEGDYANKCVFHNSIWEHSKAAVDERKQTAVKIGCAFLKNLHIAAKCEGENITPEVLQSGSPVEIQVQVKADEGYAARNIIKSISALNNTAPATKPQGQPW